MTNSVKRVMIWKKKKRKKRLNHSIGEGLNVTKINDHSIGEGLDVTKKSMTIPLERALM